MDAASRPSQQPLTELPLEEPVEADLPPQEPPPPSAAAATHPADAASPEHQASPEHADLNFTDPELYLAAPDVPVAPPAAATPLALSEPHPPLELVLEDPVIDELLAVPPAAAKAAAPTPPAITPTRAPAPTPAPKGAAKPATVQPVPTAPRTPPAPARVPIAQTASLKAAAAKLAAATAARSTARPPSVPAAPAVPVARAPAAPPTPPRATAPPAPQSERPRLEPLRAAAPRAEAPRSTATPAEAARTAAARGDSPRGEPANLAGWASARAAASTARPGAATAAPAAPSSGAAKSATTPTLKAVPAAAAPAASPVPGSATSGAAPMDRDFIARNQVVERYLSGRLPLKGATDFERFCREHPEVLDEIGLPERVNAGVRLLEASGKPEPWQPAPVPVWQKPQLVIGLAVSVAVLSLALVIAAGSSVSKNQRIAALEKQSYERALDPATSTREIRLLPSRAGASNTPAITIGGRNAQLADFKIDESRSPYHAFRVTIDRIDQGRVAVITNLAKDSNGHLHLALNSTALGPGNYQLTIEGIGWRGDPEPDSWITIGIVR